MKRGSVTPDATVAIPVVAVNNALHYYPEVTTY